MNFSNLNQYRVDVGILIPIIVLIVVLFNANYAVIYAAPYLMDKNLKLEKVYDGLEFPVSMSFLGSDDIIVLEKNKGTVHRIINGQMMEEPLLKVNVEKDAERGLLGSAVGFDSNGKMKVILYFTQAIDFNMSKNDSSMEIKTPFNMIYKYDIANGNLVNPELLFSIPTNEVPIHNGGKIIIGPDKNLYVIIGDIAAWRTVTQNIANGTGIDGTGGILRMTLDGLPVGEKTGKNHTLDYYYAYGIRNGFGMDFDPVTGNLWDTENGQNYGDEINLVYPGFNSGWNKVQGIWEPNNEEAGKLFSNTTDLVNINNNGSYSSPEVTWIKTIAITAIKFLNSTNLGVNYENDIFVGDFNFGNLYHFNINHDRTKVVDDSLLSYNTSFGGDNILVIDNDPLQNCNNTFSCYILSDDLSTNLQTRILMTSTPSELASWSMINGEVYDVIPNEEYKITTFMKLNNYTEQSNLLVQGYSEVTKLWINLGYCPSGIDGPIEWMEFSCVFKIPENVIKVRPIFNGGYSSTEDMEAISWFRNTYIEKSDIQVDLFPNFKQIDYPIIGRGFGHITDIQVGPDGNLYILSIASETMGSLTVFDDSENHYKGSIYKIVKK